MGNESDGRYTIGGFDLFSFDFDEQFWFIFDELLMFEFDLVLITPDFVEVVHVELTLWQSVLVSQTTTYWNV